MAACASSKPRVSNGSFKSCHSRRGMLHKRFASLSVESPTAGGCERSKAAFFDVDGTLARSNVVAPYVLYTTRNMGWLQKSWYLPWTLLCCAFYLIVDRLNRDWFNTLFYRSYAGMPVLEKDRMANYVHEYYMKPRVFPQALELIESLRREGHRIVLVTGSLDFLVAPLAYELGVDHVLAARMVERDGYLTGRLDGPPMSGEEKAVRLTQYACDHSMDLSQCRAYGDSYADLPMLLSVGYPEVVCGDRRLVRVAASRSWPCSSFSVPDAALSSP